MAKHLINASIVVEGDIRSKKSALNELQVMLDDYEDMNPDRDCSISINILSYHNLKTA